jgi:hypothetical protein
LTAAAFPWLSPAIAKITAAANNHFNVFMIPSPGNPTFSRWHPIGSSPNALYPLRRALCQKISVHSPGHLPGAVCKVENMLEVSGKAVK